MRRRDCPQGDWAGWSGWDATGPGAEWWSGRSSGWAWRGFARRLFIGVVILFGLGMVSLILIGATLAGLFGSWWVAAFLAPVVVIGVGILGARWVAGTWRPVSRLMRAAATLADGDYSVRVEPAGSTSIRPVVASFNDMAHRLETADAERRRLLADLGHELRTPLTVIRGEIEAMLDGVHQPDITHLGLLLDEVTVVERLLEDLRTLSLAEAGALALHTEPTDLVDLVGDVTDGHRRAAEGQGVSVQFGADDSMPDVHVDPVRMREVVTNLLVNALRAMPDGGTLTVRVQARPRSYTITVQDTGVGIEPDALDRVFERFHKGSTSQGSGLGLTISRDLVEAHGGTIHLESVPDVGTTVEVSLPAALARPGTSRT